RRGGGAEQRQDLNGHATQGGRGTDSFSRQTPPKPTALPSKCEGPDALSRPLQRERCRPSDSKAVGWGGRPIDATPASWTHALPEAPRVLQGPEVLFPSARPPRHRVSAVKASHDEHRA